MNIELGKINKTTTSDVMMTSYKINPPSLECNVQERAVRVSELNADQNLRNTPSAMAPNMEGNASGSTMTNNNVVTAGEELPTQCLESRQKQTLLIESGTDDALDEKPTNEYVLVSCSTTITVMHALH